MGDESQQEYEEYLAGIPFYKRLWWNFREVVWRLINKGGN